MMKIRIVITLCVLIIVLSGCQSTSKPETIEECLSYMVETSKKEEDTVSNCNTLIQEHVDDSIQDYLVGYEFDIESSLIYVDEEAVDDFLQLIILVNSEGYYEELICEECEEFYDDLRDEFILMTDETLKLCLNINFYANENVPADKTPIIHNFTYGEPF